VFEKIFGVLIIRSDVSFLSSSQLETQTFIAEIQFDPCPKTKCFDHVHFLLWRNHNTKILTTVGDLDDEMGG